jgi:predicted homoserine dehydrogenase-like protein
MEQEQIIKSGLSSGMKTDRKIRIGIVGTGQRATAFVANLASSPDSAYEA